MYALPKVARYWSTKWPVNMEGKERQKKEADHSRLADGTFNKTYTGGLSWMAARPAHLCTACQKFKVHIEALTGFRHIFSADGLNNT